MPRYASLDEVLASYPSRFRPDKAEGVDATVQMHFSGAHARDVVLCVREGRLEVQDGATAPDPTVTLAADADDWLAVENGDLNPMMAMMQGKVKLRGSIPFATKFMTLFGYGG